MDRYISLDGPFGIYPDRYNLTYIVMGVPRLSEWRKLPLSLTELSINTTLQCGQSFRWRKIDDEWFVCGDVRKMALQLTCQGFAHFMVG